MSAEVAMASVPDLKAERPPEMKPEVRVEKLTFNRSKLWPLGSFWLGGCFFVSVAGQRLSMLGDSH